MSRLLAGAPESTVITGNSFYGGSDGSGPSAGVVIGKNGVLYATTALGGTSNNGTAFRLKP